MTFPTLTAAYAAVLALLFTALSAWVVIGRVRAGVNYGDGGRQGLTRRIRAHGNFAEYVPLTLILVGLLEAGGAGHGVVHMLLLILLIARVIHPIGMISPDASVQQGMTRGLSIAANWVVLMVAAVLLLVRVA